MRFLFPLFLPFLLILFSSLDLGSPIFSEHRSANQSIIIIRGTRAASDSVQLGSENANNGKSIEDFNKLSDDELKEQKKQAEETLEKLNTDVDEARKALKDKQAEAKEPLENFKTKKEKFVELDTIAKEMNKELKAATDEYETAKQISDDADAIFKKYVDAVDDLDKARKKQETVEQAPARLLAAEEERGKLNTECSVNDGKTKVQLERDVTNKNRTLNTAKSERDDAQSRRDSCTANCDQKQTLLDGKILAFETANTELTQAVEKLTLFNECPGKKETLNNEISRLQTIKGNANALQEAKDEVSKYESKTTDSKYDKAQEKKTAANNELGLKQQAMIAAEATAKSPAEVTAAESAARTAKLDYEELEPDATKLEGEIAQLTAKLGELESTQKVEEAKVAALQQAYAQRSPGEKPGMGGLEMAGIGIAALLVLGAVVAVVVWFKVIKPKKDAAKEGDKKSTVKVNSSTGDNSAALAPPNQVAVPIDPTPSTPEAPRAAATEQAPAPAAALASVPPASKNELLQGKIVLPAPKVEVDFIDNTMKNFQIAPVEKLIALNDLEKKRIEELKLDLLIGTLVYTLLRSGAFIGAFEFPGDLLKCDKYGKKYCQDARSFQPFKVIAVIEEYTGPSMVITAVNPNATGAKISILFAANENRMSAVEPGNHYDDKESTMQKRKTKIACANRDKEVKDHYKRLRGGGKTIKWWSKSNYEDWKIVKKALEGMMINDDRYVSRSTFEAVIAAAARLRVSKDWVASFFHSHWQMAEWLSGTVYGEMLFGEEPNPAIEGELTTCPFPSPAPRPSSNQHNPLATALSSSDSSSSSALSTALSLAGDSSASSSPREDAGRSSKSDRSNSDKDKVKKGKGSEKDSKREEDDDETVAGKKSERDDDPEDPPDMKLNQPDKPRIPQHNKNFPSLKRLTHTKDGQPRQPYSFDYLKRRIIEIRVAIARGGKIKHDFDELLTLIHFCTIAFKESHRLLEITLAVHDKMAVAIGDTHGSPDSTVKLLYDHGPIGSDEWMKHKFIFLGDYVDRGKHSLDNLVFIMMLRLAFPNNVFMLRGNHESLEINHNYGYLAECLEAMPNKELGMDLHFFCNYMFAFMPLAAIVDDKFFYVHGCVPGVKVMYKDLQAYKDAINQIPNFLWNTLENELAMKLLWTDPVDGLATGFVKNNRGAGDLVSADYVTKFCDHLGLLLVVRAHEVMNNGYAFFANKRLVSIFSAHHYDLSVFPNRAATFCLTPNYVGFFNIITAIPKVLFDKFWKIDKKEEEEEFLRNVGTKITQEFNHEHFFQVFKQMSAITAGKGRGPK